MASTKALRCPESEVSRVHHCCAWNTDYAGQIHLTVGVFSPFSPLLAMAVAMVVLDQGTVYFRYGRIREGTASLVPRRAGNRNRSQFIELLLRARLLLSSML